MKLKTANNFNAGIDTTEKIFINGVNQCISIKSKNTNNPLLLVLHGGPGDTSLPMVRKYNKELESHYTVVVLEQRGSGKSYYKFTEGEQVFIRTFVDDVFQLIKMLLSRFKQDKVFLTAHSWGSVIGLKVLMAHPEIIHAYIGCGQVINMKKTTQLSYEFALEKNAAKNKTKVLNKIKNIDCSYKSRSWFNDLIFITRQVVKNGGSMYNKKSYSEYAWCFITSREYSFKNLIERQKGSKQSILFLWQELMDVNFESIKKYNAPVIFIEGRYDYHSSSKIVESYYNSLESDKKFFWFEKSAHFPQWSEAKRYNKIMIDLLNEV